MVKRWVWLGLLLLFACSRQGTSGGWGAPHVMTIARANDPSSLNPLFAFDQPDIDITQLYAEPLVGMNARNEPVPLVAQRVPTVENGDVARDGRTVTYHLRRGVRFADGSPLTSQDVAFTYHAILDPRNPATETQPYREIERFETPDPYTVVLHFHHPWSGATAAVFAESDFIYGILPAHAFASTDLSRVAWNDRPYGSGPFRVVEWKRGDEIVLEPNPYAWRKPHLKRLVLKIVPDRNTALMLFQTHAVDVDDYVSNEQVVQNQTALGKSLVRTEKNHLAYASFETKRPPTDDPLVRKALTEAIDTAEIARKVYHGLWPLATTEMALVLWAHDGSVRPYPYDPQAAARDLDAAGWKRTGTARTKAGRPLTIDIAYEGPSPDGRSAATVIQAYLSRVGIDAAVRGYPTNVFYDIPNGVYYGGRFNLAVTGFYGGLDPEQSEFWTCDRMAPNGPNSPPRWMVDFAKNGVPASFVLIGATTRKQSEIDAALLSRCEVIQLKELSVEDRRQIAIRSAQKLGLELSASAAEMIATTSKSGREVSRCVSLAAAAASRRSAVSIEERDLTRQKRIDRVGFRGTA